MIRASCFALILIAPATGCADVETRPVAGEIPVLSDPSVSSCQRPIVKRHGPVSVAQINRTTDFPCRVVACPAGIILQGDLQSAHPDPTYSALGVAVGTGGRIYTGAQGQPTVLAWDQRGGFTRSIGSSGEGPGEFAGAGNLIVLTGWGDSLVVMDGAFRASVFDAKGQFVRMIVNPAVSRQGGTLHLVPLGFLSTGDMRGDEANYSIHVASREGNLIRSFGTSGSASGGNRSRISAYSGDSTFWVAAPSGTKYELEQWTLSGRRLRTLQRNVSWFQAVPRDAAGRTLPEFINLRADEDGLLWVVIRVRDSRWRPMDPRDEAAHLEQQFDLRYEVIDPDAADVLASGVLDSGKYSPVFHFVPRTTLSYRPLIDSTGLTKVEFLKLQLGSNHDEIR